MQPVEHILLGFGKVSNHAMQEERRFVQQTLGRLDVFDDHASSKLMELRIFFRSEFAAGKDNHRQILQPGRVAKLLEHLEAGHVGQAQIEHHAVVASRFEGHESGRSIIDGVDIDVPMAQQFADAHLFGGIVFDHQEALAAGLRVVADAGDCRIEILG